MKPKVLVLVAHYLPGYKSGGPTRTIANMVDHLWEELDFRIITADRDALDTVPYPDVDIDKWTTVGKAQVFYASPRTQAFLNLARLIRGSPHNVLYLNSFFAPGFTFSPLLARRLGLIPRRPTVIAPRGEFSEGAFALKRWKKQPYKIAACALGLYRDITWQASSEHEVEDIREAVEWTAHRIIAAPDLPPASRAASGVGRQGRRGPGDPLRVCFLSRISPMKNLDYVFRVLRSVSVPTELVIYGPVDDEPYWQHCQQLMRDMPANVRAEYRGVLPHSEVATVLAQQDLFFLPTRGENYGHAIYEALAAGLPVLISDQTPWREMEERGIGWDIPLSEPHRFAATIEAQAALSETERAMQRRLATEFAALVATDKSTVDRNLSLFMDLLSHQGR